MPDSCGKKILYLSYDGLTDPLGQSQILPYLKGLACKGFDITLISFEKPHLYKTEGDSIRDDVSNSGIVWYPLRYHKYPPVLSTVFDLFILWRLVRFLQRKTPYAVVHCRSYLTSIVGLAMKKKMHVRFLFDMRGFWADERVDGRIWNLNNPLYRYIYRFFKKKEREFIEQSDHIVSLTDNARSEILTWQVGSVPITVIPTCTDLKFFDCNRISDQERSGLRRELGIGDNDFVLLYLGSWGTWYMTEEMWAFFEGLKSVNPQVKFLIITPDTVNYSDRKFASDVLVIKATRKQVPFYASLSDLAVFFIKPAYSKKASSATKLGELIALNIPIVTNNGWGDIETYARDLPEYITIYDSQRFNINALQLRFAKADVAKRMDWLQRHLSLESGIKKYQQIYEALLK